MSNKKNKRNKQKKLPGSKRLKKGNIVQKRISIDIESEFKKALQYHQSGQLQKAEEIYKRILDADPNHPDSLHLRGVVALQVGQLDVSVSLIKKAIQINPGIPVYYNNLGNALKDQGNLIEAISCFEKTLEIKPGFAEAHYNLGNVSKDQGKLVEAVSFYQKALELKPDFAEAYYNLGTTFRDQGKLIEAVPCFKRALEIKPDYVEVYNNMGNVFKDQGKLVEAISLYQRALEIKPNYAEAHNNMGNALNQQGRTEDAISFYQRAIENKPNYAEAYYNLGTTFRDQGKFVEATHYFQNALEIKPDYVEACNNMGTVLKEQGKLDEAISSYQRALEIKPAIPEVYNNIGNVLKEQDRLDEAVSSYRKALGFKPDYAEAYNNMGNALNAQGKLEGAISCFEKALEIKPDIPEVFNNIGNVLKDQGKLDEAVSSYQKALELKPDYAEAHNNMGNALNEQGELVEAVSSYRKALEIKPDLAEAYNNMSTVLNDMGNMAEAIPSFQKALDLKPDYAEAYNNMGSALNKQGKLVEAVSFYQKAIEVKPDYAEAYYNLGSAFSKDQGKSAEVVSCYQKALELKPDYTEAYCELFSQLQQTCAWQEMKGMSTKLDEFTTKDLEDGTRTSEVPFVSLARNSGSSRNFDVARSWSCDIERTMSTLKIHFPFDGRISDKNKIVIGYLSNDFRNHPMAHLTLGLYGLHNRDKFNIYCYSYGEDDGSYYSKRIRQDCDKFVDIRVLSHADAARRIYEDNVDILIDLKGYTGGSRLEICALRPAPVQVRYLGLPCTTGAEFFDYIITDSIAMPEEHAQYYSEKFVYLPDCYQINDSTQAISDKDWKKSDFGLPEDSFVFCSFNQGYKIGPVMFDTWMNILRQVPRSVLWFQRGSENIEKNLRMEAEGRGVKPTRLIFSERLPKDQHLGRLRLADMALDTRIVNGIITTSDALWVGVPVITLQGSSFVSRVSSSILTAIGLPELITKTLEEYESLAIDMARNPDKLQTIRQKIANNRLTWPLFDTLRFTKDLEKAYKEMWEIFVAGESPRQIEVVGA